MDVVEVYHRLGGPQAAVAAVRKRNGTQFDPDLVALVAPELLDGLEDGSWDAVIEAEPALHRRLSEPQLERALEAIADFTDRKSPFTLGHWRRVADLAAAAGPRGGLPADEIRLVRRAGLGHDLGRLGVADTVWDKPGPLTRAWRRRRGAAPGGACGAAGRRCRGGCPRRGRPPRAAPPAGSRGPDRPRAGGPAAGRA